jgi:hypothetical protein
LSWKPDLPGHPQPKERGHALLGAVGIFALALSAASCREGYAYAAFAGSLADGGSGRTSAAFALNRRPIKLELYLRLEGGSAVIELDHPDGRTTESLEVMGPGLRELRKEYPKEPGSWGLSVRAKGGAVSYWAALHDRKKYQGPDDEARRAVEGTR